MAWKSKKQNVIAHSTAEAEYEVLDDIARDLVREKRGLGLLSDTAASKNAALINVDAQTGFSLLRKRTSHDSTKHIAYRSRHIRKLVDDRIVKPQYIDRTRNVADILTKALPRDLHRKHAVALGLSSSIADSGSVGRGPVQVMPKVYQASEEERSCSTAKQLNWIGICARMVTRVCETESLSAKPGTESS